MNKNKVGLGTFPLIGVFNPITTSEAEKLVKHFLNNGGYYIDCAPLYGNGEMEKLLGRVLKNVQRESYYIITKTVKHVDEKGNLFKSGKYEDVVKQIDNSLMRLGLDYVDQLMVHQPDESVPIEETLRALEDLQKSGKVKDLAVSNVNLQELMEFNKTGKIKYVQNRFSLINRSINTELENYLLENNIYLMPYHLLEIGLLTGNAMDKDFELRDGDLREKLPYWSEENQKVIFEWVRTKLAPIAKGLGITVGQLNMAWALRQKYIDFIIVGTTKIKYLDINLKANEIKLNKETMEALESVYKDFENSIKVNYGLSVREFRGLNEKYY
jgi:aryl-alcohol dehydrogenase-like predicted oxidoreductase